MGRINVYYSVSSPLRRLFFESEGSWLGRVGLSAGVKVGAG